MPEWSSRAGKEGAADGIGDRFCRGGGTPGLDALLFLPASSTLRFWLGTISACCCSGEAEDEPARLSKSSSRLLSFFPDQGISTAPKTAFGKRRFSTDDNCAGRCGFVCAGVPRGLISWSSPRLDWRSDFAHCSLSEKSYTLSRLAEQRSKGSYGDDAWWGLDVVRCGILDNRSNSNNSSSMKVSVFHLPD